MSYSAFYNSLLNSNLKNNNKILLLAIIFQKGIQNTGTTNMTNACEFSNDVACKKLFVGCEPCGFTSPSTPVITVN